MPPFTEKGVAFSSRHATRLPSGGLHEMMTSVSALAFGSGHSSLSVRREGRRFCLLQTGSQSWTRIHRY